MALGQHAVVVEPSRYRGEPDELAERLAPLLRVPASQVAGMIARGPITVDADLDEVSGQRLLKRLDSLGIPADLRNGSGTTVSSSGEPAAVAEMEGLMAAVGESLDASGLSSASEPATDGWGAVLPGLSEPAPIPASDIQPGDVEVDERSASLIAEFEATARETPAAPPVEPSPRPEPKPRPPTPKQPPSRGVPGADKQPAPQPKQPPSNGPPADRGFDSSIMAAALNPRDNPDRPPYAPKGFDSNPPHPAKLAAWLSALAPGAGQIYNGDDDDALDYGLTFWMIKPWIESVRHARRRGEKVSTYWLPRPDEGALFRALRYLGMWWLSVGFIGLVIFFLASWGWERATREPVIEVTEAEIQMAFEDATTEVRLARIAGLQALSEAQLSVPERRFTMPKGERAERLFIIGYRHCESRNYGSCESIMRRVASLRQQNATQAFRLQAWASAARSGNVGKFPEVIGVETLTDFETAELSEQFGVPEPPKRQVPAAVPDAGTNDQADASSEDSDAP